MLTFHYRLLATPAILRSAAALFRGDLRNASTSSTSTGNPSARRRSTTTCLSFGSLRDILDLKGTKYGCGISECAACTVLVNGHTAKSCQVNVSELQGNVVTIEGLAPTNKLHVVQQAWIDLDVAQCGYCQGGQILSAVALLNAHPQPTDCPDPHRHERQHLPLRHLQPHP